MKHRALLRFHSFSEDRKYRYTLWRDWSNDESLFGEDSKMSEYVNFICLNPSTADEQSDDPTMRRCINFARSLGYGAMCMTNLFAYRSAYPRDLLNIHDPVGGTDNDLHIMRIAKDAGIVIAGWGKIVPQLSGRVAVVKEMVRRVNVKLMCLRKNSDGSPEHPLYIPAVTQPIEL